MFPDLFINKNSEFTFVSFSSSYSLFDITGPFSQFRQKQPEINFFFAAFHCKNDSDCYNKGICNDGLCLCQPGWQEHADCTGI